MDDARDDKPVRDRQLQAVLTEYTALRAEVLQKYQHHLQIYALSAALAASIVGALADRSWDVVLLVPVISAVFALRYLWEGKTINRIGRYLWDMEERKLPCLLTGPAAASVPPGTDTGAYWVGWEHYFHSPFPTRYYQSTALLSALLAFIVIPEGMGVAFSALVIIGHVPGTATEIHSFVPRWLHFVAIFANVVLAAYLTFRLTTAALTPEQER